MGMPGEAVGLRKQHRDHSTRPAIQQRSVWVATDIMIGDRDAFASLSSSTLNEYPQPETSSHEETIKQNGRVYPPLPVHTLSQSTVPSRASLAL